MLGACGKNFNISANIIGQDETFSLDVFESESSGIQCLEKKVKLDDDLQDELDSLDPMLSEFQDSVIVYIAGFVKRKLQANVRCQYCLDEVNSHPSFSDQTSLICLKDKGGLKYPSGDLVKVCQVTEKKIQELKTNQTLFNDKQILHRLCLKTTSTILTQYPDVMKSSDHENLHRYNLLKQTSLIYSTLRLKHLAREKNREERPNKFRKKLSKQILFSNQ